MAEAPAENPMGSQIHPLLRQRLLNRAATFSEGAQPPQAPRRRSSILSQYSDTRHSFRSSTEDLLQSVGKNDMAKLTTNDEVEWYHSAQQTQYVDYDEPERDDTILEEDEISGEPLDDDPEASALAGSAPPDDKDNVDSGNAPPTKSQEEARQELGKNEMLALFTCFIGPLVGAYLLHAIRSQLTRPAEGLVSNYNLTIFVMGAELRPIHHVIKMKQARMLHLQRVVRSDSKPELRKADIQEICARLANLEARATEPPQNTDIESLKIGATVRQGMQPQLDALNRAVRRYEKRQAAQAMQTEARFQELDSRLRDALALAAAAARTGQRPGIVSMLLTWFANLITLGVQTSWAVATYPYRTAAAIANHVSDYITGANRQPRKRVKGQSNGNPYAAVSTSRVQSRSGR
ncbi:uncharacterized protein N0V89_005716 [Didymosphaeria variabile]|uniref:Uncharacterized protein n=1 Tax=Didymosphaeria variabile TaxID=1932322 RepID=A0A9W8XM73_9PLEO|nr:uncharacterized protein N0V89_005716 [Didymosphaeria variabile]KAJ4353984.1 hypothetical protein N0V89_005716 [Didymosphaeria variabile]